VRDTNRDYLDARTAGIKSELSPNFAISAFSLQGTDVLSPNYAPQPFRDREHGNQYDGFLVDFRGLHVVEQRHETEIHVQLLVTMK
jgi:hypothetical protein